MPTTLIVAAAWRGTGIGNSIYHAIIAPVASSFSSLAQLRAGTRVRYTHCCGAH